MPTERILVWALPRDQWEGGGPGYRDRCQVRCLGCGRYGKIVHVFDLEIAGIGYVPFGWEVFCRRCGLIEGKAVA